MLHGACYAMMMHVVLVQVCTTCGSGLRRAGWRGTRNIGRRLRGGMLRSLGPAVGDDCQACAHLISRRARHASAQDQKQLEERHGRDRGADVRHVSEGLIRSRFGVEACSALGTVITLALSGAIDNKIHVGGKGLQRPSRCSLLSCSHLSGHMIELLGTNQARSTSCAAFSCRALWCGGICTRVYLAGPHVAARLSFPAF